MTHIANAVYTDMSVLIDVDASNAGIVHGEAAPAGWIVLKNAQENVANHVSVAHKDRR